MRISTYEKEREITPTYGSVFGTFVMFPWYLGEYNIWSLSIGWLTAGGTHELNTPTGFVSYDFGTLRGYVTRVNNLLQTYGELVEEIETAEVSELLKKADVIGSACDATAVEVVCQVVGNGPGIGSDNPQRIFDPFFAIRVRWQKRWQREPCHLWMTTKSC